MAAMAVLLPSTSFSVAASASHRSSHGTRCSVASLGKLKFLQALPASRRSERGDGSAAVLSGARVLCKGISGRSSAAGTRVEVRPEIRPQSAADDICSTASDLHCTGLAEWFSSCRELTSDSSCRYGRARAMRSVFRCNCTSHETQETVDKEGSTKDGDNDSPSGGVAIAINVLKFYKREISPLLPGSCRFVPTCSEYGMQAFKKYGVVKGAILTAWRLSRCNPLGGSGFDPPRWFDEPKPPPY